MPLLFKEVTPVPLLYPSCAPIPVFKPLLPPPPKEPYNPTVPLVPIAKPADAVPYIPNPTDALPPSNTTPGVLCVDLVADEPPAELCRAAVVEFSVLPVMVLTITAAIGAVNVFTAWIIGAGIT